jgi:GNAT superfamily N-acetyltransferase
MKREEIAIRRPRIEEIDLIHGFFEIVLKDTFDANGLQTMNDLLEEEILDKRRCINQDFSTNGRDRYFLLAEYNDEIIGSIEYGLSNELLNRCTNNEMKDLFEVGTVFVHPQYQKQGVSSLLFDSLFKELYNKGIQEICFDSGYKIAQKIWCKRFGDPKYYLRDFWGKGSHHMIWRISVKEPPARIDQYKKGECL